MPNAGYATLQVIPSLKGMEATMKRELAPLDDAGRQAGQSSGQGFAAKFSEGARNLVAPIGRMIGDIATGASIAAGGFAAASLFKGWDRLTTIQDSTRTLTIQLQDAGAAATLLDKVLGIVKGTPFALDLFANAAANLVSMGVAAEKVPGYLTAIGEASATKGKQANEFASRLATTFGQVSAQGRIMGQDVNSLATAGVNALAILANHFNVTTDQMRDMISKGAVPAGEALDVLAKGIIEGSDGIAGATVALGGTMAGLGKELSGASTNFFTAMARFGASLIKPFSPALTEGFGIATSLVDTLGARIGALAQKLVDSPAFANFLDWLREVPAKIGPLLDRLGGLRDLVVPIAAAFAAFGAGGISSALGPLGALIPAVNPILAAFVALVATSPALQAAFRDIFVAIQPLMIELATTLFPLLVDLARAAIPVLTDAIRSLVPVFEFLSAHSEIVAPILLGIGAAIALLAAGPVTAVVGAIAGLAAGFVYAYRNSERFRNVVDGVVKWLTSTAWPAVEKGFEGFREIARDVFDWLTSTAWPALKVGFELVKGWVSAFVNFWSERWGAIQEAVRNVVAVIKINLAPILMFFEALWSRAGDIFANAWALISGVVQAGVQVIKGIIDVVLGVLTLDFGRAWDGIKDIFSGAWEFLETIVSTSIETIRIVIASALEAIGGLFSAAWDAIKSVVSDGVDEVVGAVQYLWDQWSTIWGWIKGAATDAASFVTTALQPIIDIMDNIIGIAGRVLGAIRTIGGLLGGSLEDSMTPEQRKYYDNHRAMGGPVGPGDWLVGERGNGAELLSLNPGSSGYVTNASDTAAMMGSKGDVVLHQHITMARPDPTLLARESVRKLRAAQFLSGF